MEKIKIDKRKAQGAETKLKLYKAAEKLFAERDFASVNVKDITDEASITKGAFYVHFESKEALFSMLIADRTARVDADYRSFMGSLPIDLPTSEVLLALTDKICEVLMNTIGYKNMKKAYQVLLAETVDTEAIHGYDRELYALFQGVLEKGIQRGELKNVLPAEVLARHFVAAIRGISYEWCIRYPNFDLNEQAMEHIRLLIEGL
jgi:AcrR family transcriptional regulator